MYVTLFGDRRGTLPADGTNETIIALLGDARIAGQMSRRGRR
jgi:hypothetical protein